MYISVNIHKYNNRGGLRWVLQDSLSIAIKHSPPLPSRSPCPLFGHLFKKKKIGKMIIFYGYFLFKSTISVVFCDFDGLFQKFVWNCVPSSGTGATGEFLTPLLEPHHLSQNSLYGSLETIFNIETRQKISAFFLPPKFF